MPEGDNCFLRGDALPTYYSCDMRTFKPGEKHINRTAGFDVLIIMLSGTLVFYEDTQRIALGAGQWYIQRSGLRQEGRESSRQPVYFYVHFNGRYTDIKEQGMPLSGKIEPDEIRPLLERLCRAERSSIQNDIDRYALFYAVLSKLGESDKHHDSARHVVQRMTDFIIENYIKGITIAYLSRVFKYSEDHIIRLFRQQLGVTPHQYITHLKVSQVKRLLLSTDHTLASIAEETGYSDVSTLYRTFVRQVGMSPGEWRKKSMQDRLWTQL